MSHTNFRSLIDMQHQGSRTIDEKLVMMHRLMSQFTGAWQPNDDDYATLNPETSLLTQNHRKIYLVASGAIGAGKLIYINSTGKAVLASSAATGTLARGWSPNAVANNASGEFVLFEGLLLLAGIVAGTRYFSSTAGNVATSAGAVSQLVGIGVGSGKLYVRIAMQ